MKITFNQYVEALKLIEDYKKQCSERSDICEEETVTMEINNSIYFNLYKADLTVRTLNGIRAYLKEEFNERWPDLYKVEVEKIVKIDLFEFLKYRNVGITSITNFIDFLNNYDINIRNYKVDENGQLIASI